ncbi:hypothetical protein [Geobacter sp. DSM 9736]|uniref:hypothetical protein n=1 Tax=Geobacter sp. DSM 9736 TaxID=1277350 RepID=UPI000B5070B9|nr:hypothetical protein [Geobacter sp. DSM 9736]SNB45135.1 hypothetical protein SAMN06269301_0531 [Geobacter sp. DSM 9736]
MGKVLLDNLKAGMVLASDVHDRTGRLLLGAGSELSEKHLHIFRTWGVAEVEITGVDTADSTSILPSDVTQEELEAAERELAPLFRLAGGHPAMRELLRLAAIRRVLHVR